MLAMTPPNAPSISVFTALRCITEIPLHSKMCIKVYDVDTNKSPDKQLAWIFIPVSPNPGLPYRIFFIKTYVHLLSITSSLKQMNFHTTKCQPR